MKERPFPYGAIEFKGGRRIDPEASLREPVDRDAPLGRQIANSTTVLGNSILRKPLAQLLAKLDFPNHSV